MDATLGDTAGLMVLVVSAAAPATTESAPYEYSLTVAP